MADADTRSGSWTKTEISLVAKAVAVPEKGVWAVSSLLSEGATVPFIARYRKERTGNLDDRQIQAIRDELARLSDLHKRRDTIIRSLKEQDIWTAELDTRLHQTTTLAELEDLYLPYRPKRRTRATEARERGLEPLALAIMAQNRQHMLRDLARPHTQRLKCSCDDALAGARDILAEQISEDSRLRQALRAIILERGILTSKVVRGKADEGQTYRDYFDRQERIQRLAGHRLLAMLRGEQEGILRLTFRAPDRDAERVLSQQLIKGRGPMSDQVHLAMEDSYKRLLAPGVETAVRRSLKEKADREAIEVFARNLKELLMASPLGRVPVLAIDPGIRTGCKVAVLDAEGTFLQSTTIFLDGPGADRNQAGKTINRLCLQHDIKAIAVGNGTGGRETEQFLRELTLKDNPSIVMVDESGASIYSASETARQEFPDLDVTIRGAISIGRRLMDPLAELVKLDPKTVGVGQYQHDVDQKALRQSLDDVVMGCVNAVGVDINRASPELLTHVAGIGPALAANIVSWRQDHGPFIDRQAILQVPRLGAKAFEQAAGFLRIQRGRQPLDASAVHPESYPIVEKMARDLRMNVADLMTNQQARQTIDLNRYVTEAVGLPTLKDIASELARPGRDPRAAFSIFTYDERVNRLEDLEIGMMLPGKVTNITKFGAFVDVGVHQDGLVHISEMANTFVSDPHTIVRLGQEVRVRVLDVDIPRRRIQLSLKSQ